jgi:hypothetical protein
MLNKAADSDTANYAVQVTALTVAAAYGWPADIDDADLLGRLLALNRERAGCR